MSQSGKPLSSLSSWSMQHIKDVFEAPKDADSSRAIDATFSPDIKAMLNGMQLNKDGIRQLVQAMRKASTTGLKVEWLSTVEVPKDPDNRNGAFGGMYIIRGLKKEVPGMSGFVDFERRKSVNVIIESQSDDPNIDSRKLVNLVFVAADVRSKL